MTHDETSIDVRPPTPLTPIRHGDDFAMETLRMMTSDVTTLLADMKRQEIEAQVRVARVQAETYKPIVILGICVVALLAVLALVGIVWLVHTGKSADAIVDVMKLVIMVGLALAAGHNFGKRKSGGE